MASPSRRQRLAASAIVLSTGLAGTAVLVDTADAATGGATDLPGKHGSLNAGPRRGADAKQRSASPDTLPTGVPKTGRYSFLIRLKTMPTATAFNRSRSNGLTVKAAKQAAQKQLTTVRSAQNAVVKALPGKSPVLYRTHAVSSAVAVTTNVANYDALTKIPNVAAVYPIAPKSAGNSYAVPLQGAPAVWGGTSAELGQGTVVADIDTGFDYTHANFGGPGTTDAFNTAFAADAAAPAAGSYDPDKFDAKDSYDLVGDDYNADDSGAYGPYQPVPRPDPNPLDCDPAHGGDGHGSHTAGSIAGFGVNADGSTYGVDDAGAVDPSAYNESTPFDQLKIGPGMAPGAKIIAYRVFGCYGSSNVVSQAIDRAMDPNGDGDTSDHVDVINMSLGSDFGSPEDGDSIIAGEAQKLGITVAVASGNADDVPDIGGAPGSSPDVLTVAASEDAQSVADGTTVSFGDTEQAPYASERSISYPWDSRPDLAGQVAVISDDFTGCAPYTADQQAAVAGKVVLVKWTDTNLECGSVQRGFYARQAGAIGFIFASTEESFSAGITGDTGASELNGEPDPDQAIPGVLVAKSGGDAIRAAVAGGTTVTVDGTSVSSVTQSFPADDDKVADFSSRGVHAAGNVKPDVSAVGTTVFSTLPGSGSDGQTMSGTSMATPMVAGLAALVTAAHPDWTSAQVKADIMNTADKNLYTGGDEGHDNHGSGARYAPNRVGAGRIDAEAAVGNQVLAFNDDDKGSVSVSFGPVEVPMSGANLARTKTVKLQNFSASDQTYSVAYDAIDTMPGVDYKLSSDTDSGPGQVTVPAADAGVPGQATIVVTLVISDPEALRKTVDASYWQRDSAGTPVEGNGLPVDSLADASGNVVLTSTADENDTLRVPVYAAPRPTSQLSVQSKALLGAGGKASLTPTGYGVEADGGNDSTAADDVYSLGAGFELQATSGADPECAVGVTGPCISIPADRGADLKYVGTTSDYPLHKTAKDSMAYFAITTQGVATTPVGRTEHDIYIDTDSDGSPDLVVYNTALGLSAQAGEPVYLAEVVDLATGDVVDDEFLDGRSGDLDTAIYDTDTLVMPVWLSTLAQYGVTAANPRINYGIVSYSSSTGAVIDSVGIDPDTGDMRSPLSTNVYQPAVTVTEGSTGPLVDDQSNLGLQVTRNAASYAADEGKGLLYVHFHNGVGKKAQVVSFANASMAVSSTSLKVGTRGTVTVSVSGSTVRPTGKVTIKAGSKTLGSPTLSGGKATVAYTPTAGGTVKLTATYAGDGNYPALSASKSVAVAKLATRASVALSAKTVKVGRTVTVTVTLAKSGTRTPTGRVALKIGGRSVGAKSLSGGKARFTYKAARTGRLKVLATYAGSAVFKPATGSATLTVKR